MCHSCTPQARAAQEEDEEDEVEVVESGGLFGLGTRRIKARAAQQGKTVEVSARDQVRVCA